MAYYYNGVSTAQPTLTAGPGISITGSTISLSGTITAGGTGYYTTPSFHADLRLEGDNPTIHTRYGDLDIRLLIEMTRQLKDVLCIVADNAKLRADYPALQSAYEQYEVIRKMAESEDE